MQYASIDMHTQHNFTDLLLVIRKYSIRDTITPLRCNQQQHKMTLEKHLFLVRWRPVCSSLSAFPFWSCPCNAGPWFYCALSMHSWSMWRKHDSMKHDYFMTCPRFPKVHLPTPVIQVREPFVVFGSVHFNGKSFSPMWPLLLGYPFRKEPPKICICVQQTGNELFQCI